MNYLQTGAFAVIDNKIFASRMDRNGLYLYDTVSRQSRFIGFFDEDEHYECRLHSAVGRYGNDIYFLPDRSKGIYRVDSLTNQIEYLPLEIENDARFINGIVVGGNAYCIQTRPKANIISVDLRTLRQRKIDVPQMPRDALIRQDYCLLDQELFLVEQDQGALIIIDCVEHEAKRELITDKDELKSGFGTVCKVGSEFYFSAQKGLFIWNRDTREGRWIKEYPDDFGMIYRDENGRIINSKGLGELIRLKEQPFSSSFYKEGKVYFLPRRTSKCIVFDISSDKLTSLIMDGETESKESLLIDNRVTHEHYLLNQSDGTHYFFSTCTNRLYSEKSFLDGEWITIEKNETEWLHACGDDVFTESDENKLTDFLECVTVI